MVVFVCVAAPRVTCPYHSRLLCMLCIDARPCFWVIFFRIIRGIYADSTGIITCSVHTREAFVDMIR